MQNKEQGGEIGGNFIDPMGKFPSGNLGSRSLQQGEGNDFERTRSIGFKNRFCSTKCCLIRSL